ncbi:anaphase-promoting complex subunit 5-domain-containing protein [Lobosporangium transversale]|uniref:Anaphase-promoting complex subunit 5 n=1 Tax=Lobosporangium transversale TaxID=64571 RepID=A0A1Y2H2C3_9FUNG|nr:anaphase-promoting complex subunit 5-domain-containing protein [Lobosporangium transversale]ORZ28707.1 anaphase-promoting complex subunit 5-domain-containing protein [Lobosporangium transversale]|eukprot:XP_021886380.1 anaphase-promoting complex subunit 5-domain-containing protein [Lobosporangium transversale]
MNNRRPFARTATDISLRPPRTQGVGLSEQATPSLEDEALSGKEITEGRAFLGPVHVVPYLTPHKVSILILIEYYCQKCSLASVQELLLFLLKCIQDSSEYLHSDINKFGAQLASETSPDIWYHLRVTLKRIKSPSHLHDFFMSKLEPDSMDPNHTTLRKIGLQDLIIQRGDIMDDNVMIGLDPESILGLYVRKARVEFRKLSFESTGKLYCAFENYISILNLDDKSSQSRPQSLAGSEDSTVLSAFDMEKYLDFHIQQLSDMGQSDIPADLLTHVHCIQSRMPTLAKTHYLTCLHAQQTGDFEVAIQSLHRFFDYCMATEDRVLYQYALLNLAMLHVRFSHYEQALVALRETIEVARDHMDQECLSYALNWLYRLTRIMPGSSLESSEAQLLVNLDEPTDGRALHYLHALNELTIAKQMQGESIVESLEALTKTSSISLRHSLEGIIGAIQLFQSRMWGAYGYPALSSLYSQLQLRYHPSEVDMSDAAAGYSKTASDLALNGQFKEALCVIEHAKDKFPISTLKATPWVQTLVQILHRRAMSANRLRDAELLTQQLGTTLVSASTLTSSLDVNNSKGEGGSGRSGASSRENQLDDTSREIQLEILLQKALLSVLAGQRLSGVLQLSEGLAIIQQNQWPGTRKFTVMYLLALAEIYMESDSTMSAMPLLLTAMTLSERCLERPLLLLVKLRLSEALLYLESVQQASDLIDGLMSMALSQGDLFVQAMAYFQKAKCLLAAANKIQPSKASKKTRQRELESTINYLNHALRDFQKIESLKEVVQVLYFQVRAYRQLDQTDEIGKTLRQFKVYNLQLSSAKSKHEPSWYSYYFSRDAFDGILGVRNRNETSGTTRIDSNFLV